MTSWKNTFHICKIQFQKKNNGGKVKKSWKKSIFFHFVVVCFNDSDDDDVHNIFFPNTSLILFLSFLLEKTWGILDRIFHESSNSSLTVREWLEQISRERATVRSFVRGSSMSFLCNFIWKSTESDILIYFLWKKRKWKFFLGSFIWKREKVKVT